ncbi:hypothetical protein T492DRAFT_851387, partial [Pavlovales sp. CCMP2436]
SDGSNFGTRADVLARTAAGVLLACQALAHLHAELIAEQSEATVAEAACELLRAVLTECAQPLLDALELMLASVASEEALTMALKSLGSLCVMCLAVGLTDARDDCLVALEAVALEAVCMPPPPRSMHARDGSMHARDGRYGLCLETLTAALQQHHSLLTRVPAFKRSAEEIAALAAAALSDPAGRPLPESSCNPLTSAAH